jgi:hypothetical protein
MSLKRWRRWLNSLAQPGPRPPVALRPPRLKAWLRLEEFEVRLVPSCSGTVAAGSLTVSCDSADNTVTVDHAGTNTTVNGAPFADASFTAIRINTGTGGGTVNLNATPGKPTTVNEVSGNPATVELSPATHNLDTIQGAVTVNGATASGSNLVINDQAHATATTYTLTASSVARPGAVAITYNTMFDMTVNGGSGANTYNVTNTGAEVLLTTGSGNDVVNVTATSPAGPLNVQTGSGTTTVNVSPTAHNLDAIQGDVSVLGRGPSTLVVNDQAHTANTTYSMNNPFGDTFTVARPGSGTVSYFGVDFVTVNSGSGANTYNVNSTDAGLTTLNTGNGNDVVNVEATTPLTINGGTGGVAVNLSPTAHNLGNIGSDVTVNGGSVSLDSLTLNDQARTANITYTLAGSSVFWSDAFAVSFNNRIRTLTVNGGSGANTYEITGTGASTLTTLTTGNGNDVVNITATSASRPLAVREGSGTVIVNVSPAAHNLDAIQGAVTVDGGTGTDTLNVNDQSHNISATYTLTASSVARPGAATITYGSLPMNFVNVNVGGGHNTCNVTNTGALNLTTLNTVAAADAVINVEATAPSRALTIQENGGGEGSVNFSPTAHNLDAIQGTVTVNPVSGFANVVANDQAHTANTTYTQSGATLTRSGAATINYGPSPGLNVVTVNGGSGANTYNVTDTKATRLTTLTTGNGNDVVNVEATFVDINGSHSLTINGGTGSVAVNLSPTARNLDTLGGNVTLNGSSTGFTTLTLNDQAHPVGNFFVLNASLVSLPQTRFISFNQINALIINGGTGTVAIGNTFNVQSTAANTAVTIHAGGRNDTINVGNAANTLDDIHGPLTVDGQAGTDTLNVNDQGSTTPHLYSVTSTRVIRAPGGPTIDYSNIEILNFHPGVTILPPPGNGNTVDVESTDANTAVEVDAGGDITVNVGNDQTGLDDLQGPVLVLANGGTEDMVGLNVNDQITADGQQYSLAQGGVTRTGAAPISYEGIQAVVVNGGGGGNLFDVEGVSPGTPATINTGLGNNLVRMRQHDLINDALALNGQGKSDALGYRAYTTDVYVNLQTGTATDIASFTGIRNLTGGGGNNILVGDGTQDSITGGSGRNLLISGGGTGQLTGGGAGDILIGGVTAYDQDPDSLEAILAYWAGSTDDYATRVANLRQGNGVPQLEAGITVFDGGAANTLTGNGDEIQGALNLFYVTEAGTITDQQPDEVAVDIDAGSAPRGGSGSPSRFRPPITPAGAAPDERSGQLGPTAHAAPHGLGGGTAGLLPRGAHPPNSVEQALPLDLVGCSGWQPFGGLDLGIW